MLDIWGRDRSIRILRPFAILLIRARVSATTVTLIGLGLIVLGSVLIAAARTQAGAIVIGVGAILDSVDGIIARETGTATSAICTSWEPAPIPEAACPPSLCLPVMPPSASCKKDNERRGALPWLDVLPNLH